jgi:hypothetical protein
LRHAANPAQAASARATTAVAIRRNSGTAPP